MHDIAIMQVTQVCGGSKKSRRGARGMRWRPLNWNLNYDTSPEAMHAYGGRNRAGWGRRACGARGRTLKVILYPDTSPAAMQAYGGSKESGLGREGVRYAMEDYVEIRTLLLSSPGVSI